MEIRSTNRSGVRVGNSRSNKKNIEKKVDNKKVKKGEK